MLNAKSKGSVNKLLTDQDFYNATSNLLGSIPHVSKTLCYKNNIIELSELDNLYSGNDYGIYHLEAVKIPMIGENQYWGQLIVLPSGGIYTTNQIIILSNNGILLMRGRTYSGWSQWYKFQGEKV